MAGPRHILLQVLSEQEEEYGTLKKYFLDKVGDQLNFVGTRITKIEGGYLMDQQALIEETFRMIKDVSVSNSRSLLMNLAFVINKTRPKFGFTLSALSSLQDKPTSKAVEKLRRLMREMYLSREARVVVVPNARDEDFIILADASHASHEDFRRQAANTYSTRGVTFHTATGKIKGACLSATESELVALISGLKQGIYFKDFFKEMKLFAIRDYKVEGDNQ
jgi:hypothetical protein